MEQEQNKFEGWAIVELMGHQKEAGFVTTEAYGQAVLFRVDVPEIPESEETATRSSWNGVNYSESEVKVKKEALPARSRLIAPSAIYAINPCTEAAAKALLERSVSRRLIPLEAPKQLPDCQINAEILDDEED